MDIKLILLSLCLASMGRSEPSRIELNCFDCVKNGTMGFNKIIWLPKFPPEFACKEVATINHKFGIIVDLACEFEECKGIETRPITRTIPFGSRCPITNSTMSTTSEESPVTFLDLPPPRLPKPPEGTGDDSLIEILLWIVGAIAMLFELLALWYIWCTHTYIRNIERFRKSRHITLRGIYPVSTRPAPQDQHGDGLDEVDC